MECEIEKDRYSSGYALRIKMDNRSSAQTYRPLSLEDLDTLRCKLTEFLLDDKRLGT